MKTLLLITMLCIPLVVYGPRTTEISLPASNGINPYETLYRAIAVVESNNNPAAVNFEKNGYSVGILQIRQGMVTDFNRATGKNYHLYDCFQEQVSAEIFYWHCSKFRIDDIESMSRSWNGRGPATNKYWSKVSKYLFK